MQSTLFHLISSDFVKGLETAVFGAVITALYQAVTSGGSIDWKTILGVAIASGLGYLARKFNTDQKGNLFGIGSRG